MFLRLPLVGIVFVISRFVCISLVFYISLSVGWFYCLESFVGSLVPFVFFISSSCFIWYLFWFY